MSNLGTYQWITTASKKVGGPVNFVLITGAVGAAIYKGAEIAVKYGVKAIRPHKANGLLLGDGAKIYEVNATGKSNEGLEFSVGDQFKVLEEDGDAVLIEKLGDPNNPYFVSAELLCKISDYNS